MDHKNPSKKEIFELTNWYAVVVLGAFALVFALLQGISFSASQIFTLFLLCAISVIVNRYRYKVSGTRTSISAREFVVFLGIIWLGTAGGILVAASVSLSNLRTSSIIRRRKWIFDSAVEITAASAAGAAFHWGSVAAAEILHLPEKLPQIKFSDLVSGAIAMASAHFITRLAIDQANRVSTGRTRDDVPNFRSIGYTAGIYLAATVLAVYFGTNFVHVSLWFLLTALPVVIGGHLGYRFFVRQIAQKTKEIRETSRIHLATVEALATAIDARDQIGVGHVRRAQIYAVAVGELLGLPADEIQALNAGALLHGIGKLAVPDNILNKPGSLTRAEMEKTRIHSVVGASIIEKIQFPYPAAKTVKHYTELWAGGGYPDGLAGEQIPLTARILAVADAYDTLRGERPYRPAISRDQARRILQNGAGTQYDPAVVDIFLRNLTHLESLVEDAGLSYETDAPSAANTLSGIHDENYVDQIKRANREVFTMYELARVFSTTLNLDETLSVFASKIKEQVPFDTCVVYLIDEKRKFARAVYATGKNAVSLEKKCVEVGEGATGYVLEKCAPVCDINPAMDFSFDQIDFIEQYSSMASLPLIADDKLIGAVSLYSCDLENYGEEHLRLVEMVSHIAADAISMALQHAESETRALTDPMTGLPNARSLQIQFEKEVARADRNGSHFQLLMLDLDGFKAVNDTFGHKAGDRLLKELSKVMKAQLRDYDFLARYAGDEFVIIVPETNSAGIKELCQRIERSVAEFKLPIDDGRFAAVGVSLGSSCYPNDGDSIDQIIISADKQMYSTKAERKLKQTLPSLQVKRKSISGGQTQKAGVSDDDFVLELEDQHIEVDERHIVSNAVN